MLDSYDNDKKVAVLARIQVGPPPAVMCRRQPACTCSVCVHLPRQLLVCSCRWGSLEAAALELL